MSPAGAARITPPQPLEWLIGCEGLPGLPPEIAARHVRPGARGDQSSRASGIVLRFPGWQDTLAGEREVKKALRKALFKYRLHQEEELFEKAYSYIRQYY